jgi:hypothetical protein
VEIYGTAAHLRLNLTVRPEPVEGWAVKPFMLRQAQHERLNLTVLGLTGKSADTSDSMKPATNSDCGLRAYESVFQFRLLPSMNGGKNYSNKKMVVSWKLYTGASCAESSLTLFKK